MSEIDTIPHAASGADDNERPPDGKPDASVQLRRIVDDLRTSTMSRAEGLKNLIETDLLNPFFETFEKAAGTHEGLLEGLKQALEAEAPPHWESVLAYRQNTKQRVLAPLNARLNTQIADQVNKRFVKLLGELRDDMARHPVSLVLPEPPDLYAPDPDDRLLIRLRKQHILTSRSLRAARRKVANGFRRLLRRDVAIDGTPILTIDVRQLLAYHVEVRLPSIFENRFDAIHTLLSDRIATYEKAETNWTYALLEIEQRFAIPAFRVSELQSWLPPQAPEEDNKSGRVAPDELIERLLAEAQKLQDFLNQIIEDPRPAFDVNEDRFAAAATELYRDLECGDTFLLPNRVLPDASHQPTAQLEEKTALWDTWYRESSNRVGMNGRLHELRDFLLKQQESLFNSIANASIIPILNSFNQLRTTFTRASEEAIQICDTSVQGATEEKTLEALKPLHQEISRQFKAILNDVTNLLRAGQALEEPGAMAWNDLLRFIEGLPAHIEVHEVFSGPVLLVEIPKHQYTINLRELISEALLEPLMTYLTRPARALQKSVIQTWEETQQVEYTVDYNLKAAFDELSKDTQNAGQTEASSATQESDELEHHPIEAAQELFTSGLSRSSEKLSELIQELYKPWRELVNQAFAAIQTYSIDILHNVRKEDDMNDQWTNFRMKVSRSIKRFNQFLVERFEQGKVLTGRIVKLGRRQTRQLIKKGQTAVGVVDQSEDQWLQTLELASDIDALLKRLPLVYRRLFSLKPLEDLDLLEGRKLDLAFVSKHFTKWKSSQTGPLLLAMPDGSGRTSFMNVIIKTVLEEAEVRLLNLQHRVPDIQAFADMIAEALGIESEKALPIDVLETRIIGMKRAGKPRVLVIDRFEHLLLCTPGGQHLIERVLIFMSRTDNLVYWVLNVSSHAWHFLEKTLSPSSGFISAYKVTQLQRQSLEDIIIKRHHRSGMSLHFQPNSASKSFFDFSRSNSEKNLQETYRNAFFDRLYRLSGQNILLALLYWLRSVAFDSEKDTLFVNALEQINFSFLDTLDLPRAFTLKSFLTHGTLTREEHMRVFKLGQAESTFILESLLNLRIIEPAFPDPEEQIHYRIEADYPYRIHPLIVHPVFELLRRRHIIY